MPNTITEEHIFQCFAAAQTANTTKDSVDSFVDVEEYENKVMYPEFSRWARKAGYPHIADLFLKVAGEEKLHATWMRDLYEKNGIPPEGQDTARAKEALAEIRAASDALLAQNPEGVIENSLKVALRVETREYKDIYPRFRDQAIRENNEAAALIYQRVIDSERTHAEWFEKALLEFQPKVASA